MNNQLIIDSLTHILPKEFSKLRKSFVQKDKTFESLFSDPKSKIASYVDLVESMKKSSIHKSIVAGFGWNDLGLAKLSNDYILESANKSNGKILPLCSVNPLWGKKAISEIRRCYELGAKGIGELHPDTQGFLDGNDYSSLAEFMELSVSLKMPVVIHCSEPVGHIYKGKGSIKLQVIVNLVSKYPNNVFILSHFGGGLPFYSLMPEIKIALRNVYFDSAAFPYLYHPNVFKVSSIAVGYEKILFASDFPIVSQNHALKKFLIVNLTDVEKKSILKSNADNIYSWP